ncbi:hypothetical protein DEO72_LG2g4305 [Vigna unguiculata]|uniref:Uncharacterized protein n=1 Tax=Vigna unguiculata TaxID=3917 RepID=A0A4D6L653_VIGUN|nr:hypothetical protein DEO72_LG2g4305 [Vigna unguiculata]
MINSAAATFTFRTRALLGFLPKSLELAPNQFLLHLGFGTHPVSYTHLDVYKRQGLPLNSAAATFTFRTRALLGFLPKSLELAPNQFLLHLGFGTHPVSYTHLDVYKRQGLPLNSAAVTFTFRTRALLGFLPKSLELAPNQFLLHFQLLVRSRAAVLLGHASNALYEPIFQWGTVARPVNLAQASQSRLGEMKQGASLRPLHEKSPRRLAQLLSEQATRPGERDLA